MKGKQSEKTEKSVGAQNKMLVLILHNIRSTHNVGSIFRTADAAGVSKIYLTGHTPTPLDRFGRVRKDVAKVALGAELSTPWEYLRTAAAAITKLKKTGYDIIALEQAPTSVSYKKYKIKKPTALILGSEVEGVAPALLKKCDAIIEIPMRGKKESLNVSVAAGIALFELFS